MKVGLFIFPVRFSSMPPIDITYLSAYLKERGHEVYLRDFNIELPAGRDSDTCFWSLPENQQEFFLKNKSLVRQWVKDILSFSPDVVGISVWETEFYFSLEIARLLKGANKEIRIVFGGSWTSLQHKALDALKDGSVDHICIGEGERTLEEIINSGKDRRPIPGCIGMVDGKAADGGWREERTDPDTFPFPDYSAIDFSKYLYGSTYPILFNRGCNWNCSFCSHRMVWREFRSRSPESIFSEIRRSLSEYPALDRFYSYDHSMNSNMPQLLALSDLIIANGVKLDSICGYGQVNPGMLEESNIRKLQQAGFRGWSIGIQSGSDRVLRSMRRPYTAGQAEKMLKLMHKHGMYVCIDFIIGYPEETEEDFRQTTNFISRVRDYTSNIAVHPNCTLGFNDINSQPEKYGITKIVDAENWESRTSTPAIRKKRYEIAMELLVSLKTSHRDGKEDRTFMEAELKRRKP